MKYLIMEDFMGQPIAFLFPRRVDHVDFRDVLPYARAISAGFVEFAGGENVFRCFGGSAEMGLQARAEDLAIIKEALRQRTNLVGQ